MPARTRTAHLDLVTATGTAPLIGVCGVLMAAVLQVGGMLNVSQAVGLVAVSAAMLVARLAAEERVELLEDE